MTVREILKMGDPRLLRVAPSVTVPRLSPTLLNASRATVASWRWSVAVVSFDAAING